MQSGWSDGLVFGMQKGAELSAEIGYYQGLASGWLTVLKHHVPSVEDSKQQLKWAKVVQTLQSLLELIARFPTTNIDVTDQGEQVDRSQLMVKIRVKMKQISTMMEKAGVNSLRKSSNISQPPLIGQISWGNLKESGQASSSKPSSSSPKLNMSNIQDLW